MTEKATFAEKILAFNAKLSLGGIQLPEGIRAMNPFTGEGSEIVNNISEKFYTQFYADKRPRKVILGINPGRLGAGATGIPFTDTKRLNEKCGIAFDAFKTHEPSSVFVYEVIDAYGGASKFYQDFYITSLSPLGYVIQNDKGREVNYNFYDDRALEKAVTPFIIESLKTQIAFGLDTEIALLMGTGKNYKFFEKLNQQEKFFQKVVPVEHPRYVMQYKTKHKDFYIDKYLQALQEGQV